MSDHPMPPPPPPSSMRGGKSTPPPPPPGKGNAPAPVTLTPSASPAPSVSVLPTAPPMPAARPPMAGFPGMPGMGPSPIEARLQEMEKRFQEQESSKKSLESQLNDVQKQLKEEHERLIVQTLKAKEDENLSVRVDQQLREMQEKLRREKYEQELHDSRGRAETQLRELERRLAEERETWMVALRNQLKEREGVERQVEQDLGHRLQDAERRYQEERSHWTQSIRMKEEEMAQARRQFEVEVERLEELVEEKTEQMDTLRRTMTDAQRAYEQQTHQDIRALHAQVDAQTRESSTAKAQAALAQSQLQQTEVRFQEELRRWQDRQAQDQLELAKSKREWAAALEEERSQGRERIAQLERQMIEMRRQLEHEAAVGEEKMKREIMRREEIAAQFQVELAQAHRVHETEKARWAAEAEKMKKVVREEVLRDMPDQFKLHMAAERKKWEEIQGTLIRQMKAQLAQAREAQQAAQIQIQIEAQRFEQEKAGYEKRFVETQTRLQQFEDARDQLQQETVRLDAIRAQEKMEWEAQSKDYLERLAQLQQTADRAVEKMQSRLQEWTAREAAWADRETHLTGQIDALSRQLQNGSADQAAWMAKQEEAEQVMGRLREAYSQIKEQLSHMEEEHKKQQTIWAEKETVWQTEKAALEKTSAEAAKTAAAAAATAAMAPAVGPEAAKALATIRQSMQEMSTLLLWLKPVKTPAPKTAMPQKKAA